MERRRWRSRSLRMVHFCTKRTVQFYTGQKFSTQKENQDLLHGPKTAP